MQDPKTYYQEQGYYIFRQLIPHDLIDKLLEEYRLKILPSEDYFFRQSSNRWQKNVISSYGYCEESFLNVHDYPRYPSFTETAMQIFCSEQVRSALTTLTGSPDHSLMQSMLFDLNTVTPAHQDWYYLDSLPSGHLLAGWFALEDIHEEAGRFYVLPQSHLIDFDLTEDEKISNAPYVKRLKSYSDSHRNSVYAPALQKGDVLFWNSRTVHGSSETLDAQFSRKSLTAHYLPSQYQFGSRYSSSPIPVSYDFYQGMKYALVSPERKYYSFSTKLRTDLTDYFWKRPKLQRVFKFAKHSLANLQKKSS